MKSCFIFSVSFNTYSHDDLLSVVLLREWLGRLKGGLIIFSKATSEPFAMCISGFEVQKGGRGE
jgi:hypothetical protein